MNLFEDINRMRQMMGLNEETLSFEEFGLNEQLVGYEPGPFALFGHLFSKLYKAYLKGNLEKEYAILMNNDNVNSKMVRYFYDFIIDNDEYFQEKEKGVFTEQISEKESKKDFSPMIKKLLKPLIKRNKDIICDIEVTAPWNRETVEPDKSFKHYKVLITFIGGYGTKYFPTTQAVQKKYDNIIDEIWQTIYDYFGEPTDVYKKNVKHCSNTEKEEESEGVGAYAAPAFEMKPDHVHFKHQYNEEMIEGLHDTFWANEKGDKVTLIDLLKATEDVPAEKISVEELKPNLLTWDDNEDEVKKIEKADLQYPILVFVDDDGKFISIIDGHHRAQKAVRKGLKTIKAKMIPINSLPKDFRKVFGHLGKREQNESELTEKCWKGYTQKGMKTMFGKRYPNCVKKTK